MSVRANRKAIRRILDAEYDYACWIEENEKRTRVSLRKTPLFSVVLLEQGATEEQKHRCLKCLKKQRYPKLQILKIGADETDWKSVCRRLEGEYVLFMPMTDQLAPDALKWFAKEMEEHPEAEWIYADEDVFRESDGMRVAPHFKPDWSYDTFLSFFYTGNAAVYKRELCTDTRMSVQMDSPHWTYDFALHFLEKCDQQKIRHIENVLYHTSDADGCRRRDTLNETRKLKEDFIKRNNLDARVEAEERTREYRMVYRGEGLVSIIIPSKDHVQMLCDCIDSLEANTDYKDYEIIVVDNGSNEENRSSLERILSQKQIRYIYQPMEFNFSKMCNIGAAVSNGKYLLFLNDDMECIDGKWLERMVGQAAQPGVGVVGAKLLYPNGNKIQHVGVANLKVGPSHLLSKVEDDGVLEHGRNCLDYNYEAVTGACLMLERELYTEVGGFDETFPISYNDVDLCYTIGSRGNRNVVRTDALLLHHESISRGLDTKSEEKMQRLKSEREHLYAKHPWIVKKDRFYNPQMSTDGMKSVNRKVLPKIYTEMSFYATIERIIKDQGIRIEGWYWYADDDYTNQSDVYIVFREEATGKEIWYETSKETRFDVTEITGSQAFYCGFTCRISEEEAKRIQGCRVGICAKLYDYKRSPLRWMDELCEDGGIYG